MEFYKIFDKILFRSVVFLSRKIPHSETRPPSPQSNAVKLRNLGGYVLAFELNTLYQ